MSMPILPKRMKANSQRLWSRDYEYAYFTKEDES